MNNSKSKRALVRSQKRQTLCEAKTGSACKPTEGDIQELVVIIKIFPKIVNIIGILEDSNQVLIQKSIDNNPEKIDKFLRNLKKDYKLKIYRAQDIQSLDDVEKYLKSRGFDLVNPDAAGIDIGSKEHWVCVPPDKDDNNVRRFTTYTNDLYAIAQWLSDRQVKTVALESTGIYWIPLFQILEQKGFDVYLVNTKHMKRVPGRTKTDRIDCQWLQKLHSFGLLANSFRPDDQICRIRSLTRHRKNLIESNNKNIQYMQKALEQMNIKLTVVVSDICGFTGLSIIKEILDGNRDVAQMADLAHPNIKASKDQIIEALKGDYRKEHLFTLKQSLEFYYFTLEKIKQCDQEIETYWQDMCKQKQDQQDQQMTFDFFTQDEQDARRSKRKNDRNDLCYHAASYFQEIIGVDVTTITGIKDNTAQTIFSEVGFDMHRWPTENHFVSWLALCPNREATGGKVKSDRSRKVKNRAAIAFRQAASTLNFSKSSLGDFYRRIKSRRGPLKAITATARKIAIIFYRMVKYGIKFVELGPDHYIQQQKERMLRKLQHNADLLGYKLVPQNV